jgi:DNA invertase Pin-like site-specific DNA recombinase
MFKKGGEMASSGKWVNFARSKSGRFPNKQSDGRRPTPLSHDVKVALYARVSTDEQTVGQQIDALRGDCQRHGWNVVEEIADTISGMTFTRQGLDRMMGLVRRKKIDMIVCHKLDRLGRSLPHLAQMIGEFEANGVALFIPGQGIDTRQANPAGRLQMHILMAVADFERALISERTKLKLRALKAAGKHIGRPKMLKGVADAAQAICERMLAATGKLPTCRSLAKELGMSVATAHALRGKVMRRPPPRTETS